MSHKVLPCLGPFSVSSLNLSKTKTHAYKNLSPTDTLIFINSLINLNTNTLIGAVKGGAGREGGNMKDINKTKRSLKAYAVMKWSMHVKDRKRSGGDCRFTRLLIHLWLDMFLLFISESIRCCDDRSFVRWQKRDGA